MKPRWLPYLQWSAIGLLSVSAIADIATNRHISIMMAINCFCLGIVTMTMLASKIMQSCLLHLAIQEKIIQQMAKDFARALNDGRIEIIPLANEDRDTLH